jgi:GNAT superfamily N-acetyltransferase
MPLTIRRVQPGDHAEVLDVASRAWEPVFESVNLALGHDLARRLHGVDWRAHHAAEVAAVLGSSDAAAWVAELDGRVVGFAAARIVDERRRIGEVQILGVDPSAQRIGVGGALTREAEAWLLDLDLDVAVIGTGGDPGHAPARALYESLGYQAFPVVQYYKVLRPRD